MKILTVSALFPSPFSPRAFFEEGAAGRERRFRGLFEGIFGVILSLILAGGLQATETQDDPFEGFHFEIKDATGSPIELRYKNGRVMVRVDQGEAVLIAPSHGHEVPAGVTAEEINRLLQQHRVLFFHPRAVYEIDRSLVIPPDTFIDFRGATLTLKEGANAYLLRNEEPPHGGKAHLILRGGRLQGNASGQTRSYNGDYRTGYFGFGTAFTGVNQLVMQDFHLENTNAWGVAYFLCDTVRFLNFTFDQAVARGKNGDGITGIARRVYVDTVEGYTNDDLVAVSTGKGTLQGNDIGITDAQNIDVEEVVIRHLKARSKNGQRTHVGIGLYPTAGRRIDRVQIEGVEGEFDHAVYRLQNYWPSVGEGSFGSVTLSEIIAKSDHLYGSLIDLFQVDELILDGHRMSGSTKGARLLTLAQAEVKNLLIRDCLAGKGGEELISIVDTPGRTPSRVEKLILESAAKPAAKPAAEIE